MKFAVTLNEGSLFLATQVWGALKFRACKRHRERHRFNETVNSLDLPAELRYSEDYITE